MKTNIDKKPTKHKVSISYWLDSERDVYKKIDVGVEITYEKIKPVSGCVAVFEDGSPMVKPMRELSGEEYHEYLYSGTQPSTKGLLWAIRDTTSHCIDVNGNCSLGCC